MKKILAVLLAALMLFSLAACTGDANEDGTTTSNESTSADAGNEEVKAPETGYIADIITGTGGPTGTYYAFTTAVGQILGTDNYKFTVKSTGGSQANIEMIEDKEAQFAIVQNDVMNYAYEGTNGFSAPVTSFSAIGCIYPEICQVIATKASGIKTIADLKGKNVAIGDAGSGVYYNAIQILEAAGLDVEKDLKTKPASFADSATGLKDGALDAAFITAGTPTTAITDLATTTDVVVVDLGADVIASLKKDYPFYSEHKYTSADYDFIGEDETASTVYIMATFIASNDMSEEQAYEITKNLWEKQEEIATAHAKGNAMSKDTAIAAIGNVPLHPGAEKYYKEIGIIE